MKITINQAEIEEAITKHILSKVDIKEGQKIKIDLRATRGAEGFQGDIDIVDADHDDKLNVSGKVAAAKAPSNTAGTAQTASTQVKADPAPEADPVVTANEADIAAVEAEQNRGKSLFGKPTVE